MLCAAAIVAAAWVCQVTLAHADPAFKRFLPFLVDLDGWEGKKADGVSIDMADSAMTTATRDYQRGPAQLHAAIMVGAAAAGAIAPINAGMNVETGDGHMLSSTVAGMKALKSYNTKQKSGAVMIALADNAVFSFGYSGIAEDEALPLAQKFDIKGIQAAVGQK
jgi:hypothetical protein